MHPFPLNVINVKKQSIMLQFVQLRILPVKVTLRVFFNYQSNPRVMNPVLSFTVSRVKLEQNLFLLDSGT